MAEKISKENMARAKYFSIGLEGWEDSFGKVQDVLSALIKIEERKILITKRIIDESKDYEKLGKIMLREDETKLIEQLEYTIELELRYLKKVLFKLRGSRDYFGMLSKNYVESFGEFGYNANNFLERVVGIERDATNYFEKLEKVSKQEIASIKDWLNKGLINKIFSSRKSVLDNFVNYLKLLLDRYDREKFDRASAVYDINRTTEEIDEAYNSLMKSCSELFKQNKALKKATEDVYSYSTNSAKHTKEFFSNSQALLGYVLTGDSDGWVMGGSLGAAFKNL